MITILGSTGFVGSALQTRLRHQGKSVTGLSRPAFDLGKSETYCAIPVATEVLIHSAGPAGPEHGEERYWRECVQATYDLVEFVNRERQDLKSFVYISSGAVYRASEGPLTEDSETGPGNLYAMTRLLSETILASKLRCSFTAVRLFFPYGPGQSSPRLIPELIRKVNAGETIFLNGEEGVPIINPVYIDDLVSQLVPVVLSPQRPVYNLGGSEPLSIRMIAEEIGRQLGKQPVFKVNESEFSNFYCLAPAVLPTTFKQGLKQFLEQDGYV